MIYFTSDTHFQHKNIIKEDMCDRPFKNELGEPDVNLMNETLINNWNSTVSPDDEVYFLGDFAFAGKNKVTDILHALNGKIYFIWGNHDDRKHINSLKDRFVWIKDYHELWHVHDEIKYEFILFHYPIECWDRMYRGSIHLHGHQHKKDQSDEVKLKYDVGVDGNGFKPISIVEIIEIMKTRKI